MRTNNISVEQFIQEVDKHNVVGVICADSYTDSFNFNNLQCGKEDCCIRFTDQNKTLLLELDRLLHIERTACNNQITEYEISTTTSTITLDRMGE